MAPSVEGPRNCLSAKGRCHFLKVIGVVFSVYLKSFGEE
jgi:hypothetical protein